MFCIGGAILLAMLVLMAVVICLYYKVANAMPKVPVCLALKNNPATVNPDKVSAALTTGSYPSLQCCDECNLYSGFDALPPCCCNVNEGL
uniref:Family with sequence similarity 24 member A n=1 Tax=Bos mutus grunniens TaxID=30521 RepID=A0A8B9YU93_BOSMU